jgi:hypothetical protein
MARRPKTALIKADPYFSRAARELMERVCHALVSSGKVDVKGKSPEEIQDSILQYLTPARIQALDLTHATDHTDDLRRLAKTLQKDGKVWISCTLYATWFEHMLNWLIDISLGRRNYSAEVTRQVIRDVPLPGKVGWLLPILGLPALREEHAAKIRKLAEFRNSFVHYKWTARQFEERDSHKAELTKLLEAIEKTTRYVQRYVSTVQLGGNKARIAKAMDLMPGVIEWRARKEQRRRERLAPQSRSRKTPE